jgi:hypothetical protein
MMPPFGEVEDVVTYLDDIWAYLKARADGALGRWGAVARRGSVTSTAFPK